MFKKENPNVHELNKTFVCIIKTRLNSLINKPNTTELHKPCWSILLSSVVGGSIVNCVDLQ